MIALFDIGGTAIKYGVAKVSSEKFKIYGYESVQTYAKETGGKGIVRKVLSLLHALSNQYTLQGVAIATAGVVDTEEGKVLYANENIPGYTGTCWRRIVEEEFGIPCWVENDVNSAAQGESLYGAGKEYASLLMLTIGTGIGSAFVTNGHVWRGARYRAGEIGYLRMGDQSFQEIASSAALVRDVQAKTGEGALDGRKIFCRAQGGDVICKKAIEEQMTILAEGIFNCYCMLDPQVIILGGGIMEQEEYLKPIIKKSCSEYFFWTGQMEVPICFAELKNKAGMAGAYAGWKALYRR